MYPEVERRRAFLRALHAHIEASDAPIVQLQREDMERFATAAGLSFAGGDRLLVRLVHEGYVIAQPTSAKSLTPFARTRDWTLLFASVQTLADKDLREIGELPSENAYEALIAGIEQRIADVRADDSLPEERKQREAGPWVSLLRTLAEIAGDVGAPVLGEVIKRSVGF